MGEKTIAAGVLFAALLACGGGARMRTWEPYSASVSANRIAHRAVVIGRGDLGEVRKAGGMPLATLIMTGNPDYQGTDDAAAQVAAEGGGTHIILGTVVEGGEDSAAWSVQENAKRMARYVVIRVPLSGWDDLYGRVRPLPYQGRGK